MKLRTLVLGIGLLFASAAYADDPRDLEAVEARKDDLRHRHLWIAYSLVWFTIHGFVFATWRQTRSTANELDELRARLAELDGDGGENA
jgi:hypothetical protein